MKKTSLGYKIRLFTLSMLCSAFLPGTCAQESSSEGLAAELSNKGASYTMSNSYTVVLGLTNTGTREITSCAVYYRVDGMDPVPFSQDFLRGIAAGASADIRINVSGWADLEGGRHQIDLWLSQLSKEDVEAGDTLRFSVSKVDESRQVAQQPLLEIFGNVYCTYCEAANEYLHPELEKIDSSVSVVKWHCLYGGSRSDIYTTDEAKARFSEYYPGNTGIPRMNLNGAKTQSNEGAGVMSELNNLLAANPKSFLEMRFDTLYAEGENLHVEFSVSSAADAAGLDVYAVVTEREANASSSPMYNVEMAMQVPTEQDPDFRFVMDSVCSFQLDFDMSRTACEEMEDLRIVVFVQDEKATVYQSAWADVTAKVVEPDPEPVVGTLEVSPVQDTVYKTTARPEFSFALSGFDPAVSFGEGEGDVQVAIEIRSVEAGKKTLAVLPIEDTVASGEYAVADSLPDGAYTATFSLLQLDADGLAAAMEDVPVVSRNFTIVMPQPGPGPDTTANEAGTADLLKVYARDQVLYVENASTEYEVFDMRGSLVYKGRKSEVYIGRTGLYLIRIGDRIKKVFVL